MATEGFKPSDDLSLGQTLRGFAAGQKLFTLEAMKMETTVYAERAGKIASVLVQPGSQVETGDLLLRYDG